MRVASYRTFPGSFTLNFGIQGDQDDTGHAIEFDMREGFDPGTRSVLQFNIQTNSDIELFIHLNGFTVFEGNVGGQQNGFRSSHIMLGGNALRQDGNTLEFGIPNRNGTHISISDVFILHAINTPE